MFGTNHLEIMNHFYALNALFISELHWLSINFGKKCVKNQFWIFFRQIITIVEIFLQPRHLIPICQSLLGLTKSMKIQVVFFL